MLNAQDWVGGTRGESADVDSRVAGMRVVVADDEPFLRIAMAGFVRALGATVVAEAANGREALATLRAEDEPVDAIVSDLNMPELNGIELIQGLADHALNPAVIFVSGSDPRLLRAAEMLAVTRGIRLIGALEKPLSKRKLADLLSTVREDRSVTRV